MEQGPPCLRLWRGSVAYRPRLETWQLDLGGVALDQREMNALAASEDIAQIIVEAGEEMKEKYWRGKVRLRTGDFQTGSKSYVHFRGNRGGTDAQRSRH
jgi:hypothetical protein